VEIVVGEVMIRKREAETVQMSKQKVLTYLFPEVTFTRTQETVKGGHVIKRALFAIITCLLPLPAIASPCDNYAKDKAAHFADIAGKKIVDGFGGGQNVRVEIYDCDYNTFSEEFDVKIGIYWNGAIISSNSYNIDGILTLTGSGAAANFAEIYASDSVDDLRTMQFMVGGAVALGELSDENRKSIKIKSNCDEKVRVAIRHNYAEGSWITEGWWEFSQGEESFLLSNGEKVQTINAFIYIYVEDMDGNMVIGGDHDIVLYGRTLRAIEFEASQMPMRITICS